VHRLLLVVCGLAYLTLTVVAIWYNLYSASFLLSPVLVLLVPYWLLGRRLNWDRSVSSVLRSVAFLFVCIAMAAVVYLDVNSAPWHLTHSQDCGRTGNPCHEVTVSGKIQTQTPQKLRLGALGNDASRRLAHRSGSVGSATRRPRTALVMTYEQWQRTFLSEVTSRSDVPTRWQSVVIAAPPGRDPRAGWVELFMNDPTHPPPSETRLAFTLHDDPHYVASLALKWLEEHNSR
jgi:hypothetical protein